MASAAGPDFMENVRIGQRTVLSEYDSVNELIGIGRSQLTGSSLLTVMGEMTRRQGVVTHDDARRLVTHDRQFLQEVNDICQLPPWVPLQQRDDQLVDVIANWTRQLISQVFFERNRDFIFQLDSEFHRLRSDVLHTCDSLVAQVHAVKQAADKTAEAAVSCLEHQFPLSRDRMAVINRYEDEMQYLDDKHKLLDNISGEMSKIQDEINWHIANAPDTPARQIMLHGLHQRRQTQQQETDYIEQQIIRKFKPNIGRNDRQHVQQMEKMTDLSRDHGRIIETIQRKYFVGREQSLYIVIVIARRMFGDYNVRTGEPWYPTESDIPASLRNVLATQEAMWFQECWDSTTSATDRGVVGVPLPTGHDGKSSFTARKNVGSSYIHALQVKYVRTDALHQENLVNKIVDAAEHFKGGNPAKKIVNILRPTMEQILSLQIPLKPVLTLQPMMRILSKRDDKFKEVMNEDRYLKCDLQANCAPLLSQFFTDVEKACDDIERLSSMKPEDLWKSNRWMEMGAPSKKTVSTNLAEATYDDGDWWYEPEENPTEEADDMVTQEEAELYDEDTGRTIRAQYTQGFRSSKGKGRKGSGKGKGKSKGKANGKGKGTWRRPVFDRMNEVTNGKSKKVICDGQGCTTVVSRARERQWNHLCTSCVGNAHRNGGVYTNRQGESKQLTAQNAFVPTEREKSMAQAIASQVQQGGDNEGDPTAQSARIKTEAAAEDKGYYSADEGEDMDFCDGGGERRAHAASRPPNKRHKSDGMEGLFDHKQ